MAVYNTGITGFISAVTNPNRVVDTQVGLYGTEYVALDSQDVVSYKITSSSTSGKQFVTGSFVAATMDMVLNRNSKTLSSVDFKTNLLHNIKVNAIVRVGSQRAEIPLGVFYPDDDGIVVNDNGQVTIKAKDLPPIMYEQFDSTSLNLPCTVQDALGKLGELTGLTIHVSADDFPNLSVTLSESFSLVASYRNVFAYVAEVLGAYCHMGRDGSVYLEKLYKGIADIGCVLDDNYLFSVSVQDGTTVKPFQYIGIKANADDVGSVTEVNGVDTGYEYDIINNPLTYGHPADFLSGLVQPLRFETFTPAKISFQGRPDLDLGDVLQYVYKGTTYALPVCLHTLEYNGGFKTTVEGIGTDIKQTSSTDSSPKTKIEALKQNINTLVRDLSQTQSQITGIDGDLKQMTTLLQTLDTIQTQVSEISGDVEKLSTLTQTADGLRLDIKQVADDLVETTDTVNSNHATLLSYFDFKADGLTIGVPNSDIKLKLSSDKIQFLRQNSEVAHLSDGQLYVTDGHFINKLILGNFEFVPRTNGNLSLIRR